MKGLKRRYACLDHLAVAATKAREGDGEGAEEHMSAALTDPLLDDALEDLDDAQDAADEEDEDESKDEGSESEEAAAAPDADAPVEENAAPKSVDDTVSDMIEAVMAVAEKNGYPGFLRSGSDSDDEAYAADLRELLSYGFPETAAAGEADTTEEAPEEGAAMDSVEATEEEASMMDRVAERVRRNLASRAK